MTNFSLNLFFFKIFLGFVYFFLLVATDSVIGAESTQQPNDENTLEVFVQDGCPHCADAKEYLPEFALERPWLKVVYRSLNTEPESINELAQYYRNAGIWPPGVPTFVMDDRIMVGFDSADITGPELARFVDLGTPAKQTFETELFGSISVPRLGLPLFTLAIGLLDGFNPCAMWVLMFLLSLLVHLRDRKRMAIIAGTFVLTSGLVYYVFMAAWLNLFLLIGFSRPVVWTLGSVALIIGAINIKYFLRPQQGVSLSIPSSAKPGLYTRMRSVLTANSLLASMAGVTVLAIIVNLIELLCTAGFPAIYTAVLTQQELNPLTHYAYIGLYILAYMTDDALMVTIAVVALSSHKLSEQTGRWLKLVSGSVMSILGLIMLLRPEWLIQ